jgi:hypothetical protein
MVGNEHSPALRHTYGHRMLGAASWSNCKLDSAQPSPVMSMSSTVSALAASHLSASSTIPDPDRLAPEDAYFKSPPRGMRQSSLLGLGAGEGTTTLSVRKRRDKDRSRSSTGRRKGNYKKLLWFKQPCKPSSRSGRVPTDECSPRQLHRRRDVPRPSPAKPTSPAIRVLVAHG